MQKKPQNDNKNPKQNKNIKWTTHKNKINKKYILIFIIFEFRYGLM